MILRVRVNILNISAKAAFVIGLVKFYAKKVRFFLPDCLRDSEMLLNFASANETVMLRKSMASFR